MIILYVLCDTKLKLSGVVFSEKANDRKLASECHREETFAASRSVCLI